MQTYPNLKAIIDQMSGDVGALTGLHDDAVDGGRHVGHIEWIVLGGVSDAHATAEIEVLDRCSLGGEIGGQIHDARCSDLESGGVEDLRSDVRMQPGEAQGRVREDLLDRCLRFAAGQRQSELLVLVGGRDELMRVRLDTDRDTHQHIGHQPESVGHLGDTVDLGQ